MTPPARIAAAIELLSDIKSGFDPADVIISEYFRKRRYAGSGDRRKIREIVYNVLRNLGILKYWLIESGGDQDNPRSWLIISILVEEPESLESYFVGGRFGPASISTIEKELIERLESRINTQKEPDARWALLNCPEWILEYFDRAFCGACDAELKALNSQAPVDLRVNLLKTTREHLQSYLSDEGRGFSLTTLSPFGLRSMDWSPLLNTKAFKDGLFEVQDESSQILALVVNAQPGERVVDLCAGAGGKTLALAMMMKNKGEIIAADASDYRLRRSRSRIERAGISIINEFSVESSVLAETIDPVDRVLIDAPCTGSGAWRRNPEVRWQLTPDKLRKYRETQEQLLHDGSRLVRSGGWLIYATCSLFLEENEEQVDVFLKNHKNFRLVTAKEFLGDNENLSSCVSDHGYLRMSPAQNKTDGVFAAIFEKF
ncbi:MAG: rRNA cytosine-C5-methylase [Alphaproteobacteria bacterium]|jgi:16S rRNA (cytosine967-C5)-methyltransferase|nr:rRNA cytosine-C5-methylase [Alphaproteobacteria bacterium]PPR13579.1 MAG: Ribosomal RNA small subunit methyltransferase F [Alphaproteobacteria bacterium MarineAlpha12_Bin1]|tara:strand:- start:2164 stop:3456 length:1293 start_codon:yes stop_codon:yes gene_type:complete